MDFSRLLKIGIYTYASISMFTAILLPARATTLVTGDINTVDIDSKLLGFKGRGAPPPGERTGGGTRGDCPDTDGQSLIALVPEHTYGETISEHPTLWFYVPYTADQVARGEFSLQDENGDNIAESVPFTLPNDVPGFVSITLPEVFALETVGDDYQWYFELYCIPNGSPVSVYGWIQNVGELPELEDQLNQANSPEDVVFAEYLIWFDAVNSLAELRAQDAESSELTERWNQLMTAEEVFLQDLPEAPFVGSVRLETSEPVAD